jgi:hypothetical protein
LTFLAKGMTRNGMPCNYRLAAVNEIISDFILSNRISVEKFVFDQRLDSYFQTETRSCIYKCTYYLNGLILLPNRRNLINMPVYSSKMPDNQTLSRFLSNSPRLYKNLFRSVRTKAIETIGENGILILDES